MRDGFDYTRDEMLTVCMAREIPTSGVVAQGISTPLVSAAYRLAKLTHAPEITISYTVGNTFSKVDVPIRLTDYEAFTIRHAIQRWSFVQAASEYLHSIKPWIEFFRPAQIDAYGNTNNVSIGDYHDPKVRLPGCAGIGDVTNYLDNIMYYIPRHDVRTLVEKVDFISGIGWARNQTREKLGLNVDGPKKMITELCIFEFVNGKAQLVSIHPYSSVREVKENTGFDFHVAENLQVTPRPTPEEIDSIRNKIDPLGIRKIEMLSGKVRLSFIKEIIAKEKESYSNLQ